MNVGPVSVYRPYFPHMGIPMLKIRRSQVPLIFNMGTPILVRWQLYTEMAPWQGWGQIRFIKYKYKYKCIFFWSFKYKYKYKYTGKNLIKYKYSSSNTNTNTQWGRDKIAAILQMTYKNVLNCKKIVLFIKVSLKIVSKCPIYNKPTLVQIMVWRWAGNKPISDQWWPGLLMHKRITQPKWVNVKCSVADCYLNVV